MDNMNCGCKINCVGIAFIVSLIVGIVAAFLTITAVITLSPLFLGIAFGIAIVYLAVIFLVTGFGNCFTRRCEGALNALLLGILGTIITSGILFAVTFAATSVIGAIIAGALLFFFALIVTATACLVRCLAECVD